MNEILLGAIDNGNGKSAGLSSAIKSALRNPVIFEPVFAPMTNRRGLDDVRPTITLRVDDQVYVFGADNVHDHGERSKIIRPNNEERYGSPEYLTLIRALLLQMFPAHRGKERISPTLILSVPVEQYNDNRVMADLRNSIYGITAVEDMEGSTLRLEITPKRLQIIPESAGALSHYAFDERSLNPRKDSSTVGITVVVDIGFLTTNISLFEGTAYQRDTAFTVERGGFSVVVYDIQQAMKPGGRSIETTYLDRALKAVAGIPMKKEKKIDIGGGAKIDVQRVYDPAVEALADLIKNALLNRVSGQFTRVLVSGGGMYHLGGILKAILPDWADVVFAPNPELANVYGAYTMLRQQAAKVAKFVED